MQLLFFNQELSKELMQALCWTLIHSLWQGLLAGIIAGIIINCTKRATPKLRYNLLLSVLWLMITASGITFISQLLSPNPAKKIANLSNIYPSSIITAPHQQFTSTGIDKKEEFINSCLTFLDTNATYVVLLWSILFMINAFRLAAGLRYIHRIKHHKTSPPPLFWKKKIAELTKKLQIKQRVILLQSELIRIPVAIGFLKPMVLVPVGLLTHLPADQVEAILLHELAHINRKDYLVNLLQSIAETFFFFNPAVLWISSLIRQEREACCDESVIHCTGKRESYIKALLSFEENYNNTSGFVMALGNKTYLLDRVKRMFTQKNKKLNIMEKTILSAGIVIAATLFGLLSKNTTLPAPAYFVSGNQSNISSTLISQVPQSVQKEHVDKVIANFFKPEEKDTVPDTKSSEINNTINIEEQEVVNEEHETSTSVIQRAGTDGKKYKVVKENGEIVLLQINGRTIPKEKYKEYADEINQLEQSQLQNKEQRRQHQEMIEMNRRNREAHNRAQIERNKELQGEMDRNRAAHREQMQQFEQIKKEQEYNRRKQSEKARKLSSLNKTQSHKQEIAIQKTLAYRQQVEKQEQLASIIKDKAIANERRLAYNNTLIRNHSNDEIEAILEDLSSSGIISDDEGVSFKLNDKELVVNGKKQKETVHKEFKERYIRKPGDLYEYSHHNGTTTTTITKDE